MTRIGAALCVLVIVLMSICILLVIQVDEIENENNVLRDTVRNYKYENEKFIDDYLESHKSPLGFCVGDNVTSNAEALRMGINMSGTVVKISGEVLTIDETGYEDFNLINEAWMKHDYMVQGLV